MVVDALLEEMRFILKKKPGTRLEIRGFGTFTVAVRKSRAYKVPNKNTEVVGSDHPTVRFRVSKNTLGE